MISFSRLFVCLLNMFDVCMWYLTSPTLCLIKFLLGEGR